MINPSLDQPNPLTIMKTTLTASLRSLSPVLRNRIERLAGCQGTWYVDQRDRDWRSYDVHNLPHTMAPANVPPPCVERVNDPVRAAEIAASHLWREIRILFSPSTLDGDCSWPGGYDAPACYASNARVFREDYKEEMINADGDYHGTSLDVRFITDDMLETIESLENYPVMDEGDMSQLEHERQEEAWESWAASDWTRAVVVALDIYAPEDADEFWAEEIIDTVSPDKLQELFYACAEQTNTYWEEQSDGGQYIDVDRIAKAIDRQDLQDLTALTLLPDGQKWRREPYPWLGAEAAPLLEPPTTGGQC